MLGITHFLDLHKDGKEDFNATISFWDDRY